MEPPNWDPRARMRSYAPAKSWGPFAFASPYGNQQRPAPRTVEENSSLFSYGSHTQSLSESLFAPFFRASSQVHPPPKPLHYSETFETEYQDVDQVDWSYLQDVRPFEAPLFNSSPVCEPKAPEQANIVYQEHQKAAPSEHFSVLTERIDDMKETKLDHIKQEVSKNGDYSKPFQKKSCKFYTNGSCKYGAKCTFLHEKGQVTAAPLLNDESEKVEKPFAKKSVCKFYHLGTCKKGNRCSYLHVLNRQNGILQKIDEDIKSTASESSTPPAHFSPRSSVDIESEIPKPVAPVPLVVPKEEKKKKKKKKETPKEIVEPVAEVEAIIESIAPVIAENIQEKSMEEATEEPVPEPQSRPISVTPTFEQVDFAEKREPVLHTKEDTGGMFGLWFIFMMLFAFFKEVGNEAGEHSRAPRSTQEKFWRLSKKLAYLLATHLLLLFLFCFQQLYRLLKLLGKLFMGNKTGSHYGNSDWDQESEQVLPSLRSSQSFSKQGSPEDEEDENSNSGMDEHEEESSSVLGHSHFSRKSTAPAAMAGTNVATKKKKGKAKRRN